MTSPRLCPKKNALAYNSVLTTIRILEQKGYVQHRKEGRAFFYVPLVAEEEAGISEVRWCCAVSSVIPGRS
jgi:predicted transcriptional regulator